MKLSILIAQLMEHHDTHGDIDVMVNDNDYGGPYSVLRVSHKVTEKDDYPKDYNMPEGFEFIEISG